VICWSRWAEQSARLSLLEVDHQRITDLDALIEQIVAAGQACGELRTDMPAAYLAAIARSAYFLAVFEWLRDGNLDLSTRAARFLDANLDGIVVGT
jgi:hypothetical protein